MALPVLTVSDMADFKGKEEMSFGVFASKAIEIATVLVENVVGVFNLADDDVRGQTLYSYAVLDMAYEIYLELEYAEVKHNPFNSETIGSYSYSKSQGSSSRGVRGEPGLEEGSIWMRLLDAYLATLSPEGSTNVSSGGIIGMEYDGVEVDSRGRIVRILSPKDDIQYFDAISGNETPYGPHYPGGHQV